MATRIMGTHGSRVVGSHLPLNVLLGAIPSLPRPVLARLTERMIERLDTLSGDPDLEEDDPAEDEDSGTDAAWREDVCHLDRASPRIGWNLVPQGEDDEDDDPAGGNVEDEGEIEQTYG